MDGFFKELAEGEILFRDDLQFELKSEFTPVESLRNNVYKQEFYLFIPNALGINKSTYSRGQFYRDQTNLIRYKTPDLNFKELLNPSNERSPFVRLRQLWSNSSDSEIGLAREELKLLGNIVRSQVRNRVKKLVTALEEVPNVQTVADFHKSVVPFIRELELIRVSYLKIEEEFQSRWKNEQLDQHFAYVDEFISTAVEYYLTGLLESIRAKGLEELQATDDQLCELLVVECHQREARSKKTYVMEEGQSETDKEFILYRRGLLNKFVLDALLLPTDRLEIQKKHANIIGMVAAGAAMTIYLLLFIWQGEYFVLNSIPFVLITVFLYILKDRIKEGLKVLYAKEYLRWFCDYETDVLTPEKDQTMGRLKESMTFLNENEILPEVIRVRDREFHSDLELIRRPESILYYKKEVQLSSGHRPPSSRRYELNNIFRFNIHCFLEKASNPRGYYRFLNADTRQLAGFWLPKVYHVNIIMRNTWMTGGGKRKVEMKKYRLIMDKHGIKRVERVRDRTKPRVISSPE